MTIDAPEKLQYENAEKFFAKPIKTIHESCFWDEDDIRHGHKYKREFCMKDFNNFEQPRRMDLNEDSYVWDFTGWRGSGKGIATTFYSAWANYEFGKDIVSNYPIRYNLKVGTKTKFIESEPLDVYKVLLFDGYYERKLVVIDEAPEVLGHMAAMSVKNRMMNSWIRELRKGNNTLFLDSQSQALIDKSSRWQVDVIITCKDLYRKYGSAQGLERGTSIALDFYDNSGQWTGDGFHVETEMELYGQEATDSLEIPGRIIFDTYPTDYTQNILDGLRRVELKLGTVSIGDGNKPDFSPLLEKAIPLFETIFHDGKKAESTEIFGTLGLIGNSKEKAYLNSCMARAGIRTSANGTVKYFDNYDSDKFRSFIEND